MEEREATEEREEREGNGPQERRPDARRGQQLHRHPHLLDDGAVRDDRRRPELERVREERPGQKADEQEDGVRLLARRGVRTCTKEHAEEEPEHHKLRQRHEEVPGEAERRSLVARAKLTPREVREQVTPLRER